MKKVILILVVFIVLVVGGLAVFVATFDIDRYRPQITAKIEEFTGKPASIGELSLKLAAGVVLEVKDLALYDGAGPDRRPAFSSDLVRASLDLMPLLRREIRMGALKVVAPRIRILRDARGNIAAGGIELAQEPSAKKAVSASSSGLAAKPERSIAFFLNELRVENGRIEYRDQSADFPMDVVLKEVDLTLRNVSLDGRIGFQAEGALFCEEPNIFIRGNIEGLAGGAPVISDAEVKTDLGRLDFEALLRGIPGIAPSGIRDLPSGNIRLDVRRASFGPSGLAGLESELDLSGGHIVHRQVAGDVKDLELKVSATEKVLDVRQFSASLWEGSVDASARAAGYLKSPRTEIDAKVQGVRILRALEAAGQGVKLDGKLDFSFKGNASGKDWDEISRTLNGGGDFKLSDGMILDGNPLREMVDKMSVLPGFREAFNKHVPEAVKQRIDAPVTPILKPLEHSYTVERGNVSLRGIELATELFVVQADLDAQLSGSAQGEGTFIIGSQVADSMVRGAQEVSYLTDSDGRISVPIKFEADSKGAILYPDFGKFSAKAVMDKGRQFISDLLSEGSGDAAAQAPAQTGAVRTGTAPAAAGTQEESPWADLIRQGIEKVRSSSEDN